METDAAEPKEKVEVVPEGRCYGCGKIRQLRQTPRGRLCRYCEGRETKRVGLKARPRKAKKRLIEKVTA